jgi:hypothetical protein
MPCYRCGTRQVDPDRGQSPWKRGVRADHQVLVCPGCQETFDWGADLDRCAVCTGLRLVRRLGEIECKDCGHVRQPADGLGAGSGGGEAGARPRPPGDDPAAGAADGAPGLAEDVERALARVLGRSRRTAGIG